jgi:hypothetical protein
VKTTNLAAPFWTRIKHPDKKGTVNAEWSKHKDD